MKPLTICAALLCLPLLSPTAWAQSARNASYARSPSVPYYVNPTQVPKPYVGASYNFSGLGPSVYYEPTYSSFYAPRASTPVQYAPGPWWYTRNYPYTLSYYDYYYTPGYFRY